MYILLLSLCDHPLRSQVNPVTILKSELTLQHVRNIAVSPTYICYSLKLGQVRHQKPRCIMSLPLNTQPAQNDFWASIGQFEDLLNDMHA